MRVHRVKPVTPEEARAAAEFVDTPEVQRAVESINDSLKSGSRTFALKLLGKNERVRGAVVKAFESAGWRLKYQPDQRDGDYYEFS